MATSRMPPALVSCCVLHPSRPRFYCRQKHRVLSLRRFRRSYRFHHQHHYLQTRPHTRVVKPSRFLQSSPTLQQIATDHSIRYFACLFSRELFLHYRAVYPATTRTLRRRDPASDCYSCRVEQCSCSRLPPKFRRVPCFL